LFYRLTRGGRPVTDLSPYLGAAAHVAIVSEDTRSFAHTHGEVGRQGTRGGMDMPAAPARFGPSVPFRHVFGRAGLYKIWAQFGYHGRVLTVPFVVLVR
jgi:Cu+-exporting ATPase